MTNTMTPSEIAERLGHAEVYEIDDNNHALGNLLLDAAATIRQLEARVGDRNQRLEDIGLDAEGIRQKLVAANAKLKIATEALEVAGSEATRGAEKAGCDGWRADAMCRSIAKLTAQALARIKEVEI